MILRNHQVLMSLSWKSVVWCVNGFFILMTVIFHYLPNNRQGAFKFLAMFSLQFEKNLATYWEGWCFLLVAVLAFQRFLASGRAASYERQAWVGLSILAAGLSLDELGSIHERAKFMFSPWGLTGRFAWLPLAVPALAILVFTLYRMLRLRNYRDFSLMVAGWIILGSVPVQEHLEHTINWPWWFQGLRFGLEEGTELVGAFLLLCVVTPAKQSFQKVGSLQQLAPEANTLIKLRPTISCVTLLAFVPLAMVTVWTEPVANNRGIPAAWLPFVCLNMASLAAWTRAREELAYRNRFLIASALSLLFSLDQIIVFERILDMTIMHSRIEKIMFPIMAGVLLCIPYARTRFNVLLISLLSLVSVVMVSSSKAVWAFAVPLQSLAIFWVGASMLLDVPDMVLMRGEGEARIGGAGQGGPMRLWNK